MLLRNTKILFSAVSTHIKLTSASAPSTFLNCIYISKFLDAGEQRASFRRSCFFTHTFRICFLSFPSRDLYLLNRVGQRDLHCLLWRAHEPLAGVHEQGLEQNVCLLACTVWQPPLLFYLCHGVREWGWAWLPALGWRETAVLLHLFGFKDRHSLIVQTMGPGAALMLFLALGPLWSVIW